MLECSREYTVCCIYTPLPDEVLDSHKKNDVVRRHSKCDRSCLRLLCHAFDMLRFKLQDLRGRLRRDKEKRGGEKIGGSSMIAEVYRFSLISNNSLALVLRTTCQILLYTNVKIGYTAGCDQKMTQIRHIIFRGPVKKRIRNQLVATCSMMAVSANFKVVHCSFILS